MRRLASLIGVLSGIIAWASMTAHASASDELDLEAMGLQGGTVVSVPEAILDPDGRSARVLIPIAEEVVVLDLVKHSVRSNSYQMVAVRPDGRYESVAPTPVETCRGSVVGDPGSMAAISLMPHGIAGRVKSSGGREFWIEPIAGRVKDARPRDHVVYESDDVASFDGRCGVTDPRQGPLPDMRDGRMERMSSGMLCSAQIVIDCDFPFYQLMGEDLENLGRRVELVLNTMNLQYNTQVGIDHKLTMILVRTSADVDPYVGNNLCIGTNGLEEQVIAIWSDPAYQPLITRDIVHLFTARETGSVIGCNTVGEVCQGLSYGGSRIDYNGMLSTSTDLLAHELGHGWGASHCACSNPPYTMNSILMSANDFSPNRTIPTIIDYRNEFNDCLECTGETTEACGAGSSTCYSASDLGEPFCEDEECCIIMCAIDRYCCEEDWDFVCADNALTICAGCGDEDAGPPLQANGTRGCSDLDCCAIVCGIDPFCCSTEWDDVCADYALGGCTSCGDEQAGSPYETHAAGSDDFACCDLICDNDPICCLDAWDMACVVKAVSLCAGCGDEEAGSPFINNETPGCEDADCCVLVCEIDRFCCDSSWDIECARSAALRCVDWCVGDFNFDGKVEGADLGIIIAEWGSESAELEDLNDDLIVDGADFGIFLGNWGECDY